MSAHSVRPVPAVRATGSVRCGLAVLFGLVAVAACGRGPESDRPVWIPLSPGFRPAPIEALRQAWARSDPPVVLRDGNGEGGVWIDHALEPEVWRLVRADSDELLEEWRTTRPEASVFERFGGERVELRLDGRSIPMTERRFLRKQDPSPEECFLLEEDQLSVLRPTGAGQPPQGVLSSWLERGHEANGTWRSVVGRLTGNGFTLWPGERYELVRDLPAASALRLNTVASSLGHEGNPRFRVWLDDQLLLEHEQELGDERSVAHTLPLPAGGRRDARLVFEVEGPPAVSAVLRPTIGPLEVGTYGSRPWSSAPDIVLFLADTFRADNLAAYGGSPDICPELNHLADRSLRFLQARAASVWTLPSHASLFTGLYPPQHGAVTRGLTLPAEAVTLAEQLARAGYRTGAVTDSGYVSRHFGLDQGFGWFQEQAGERRLARTLEHADEFLARDDGRPVFLFVHTYRTHMPYRLGPDESEAELASLLRRVRAANAGRGSEKPDPGPFAAESLELYRGGAQALDVEFGPWFESLERKNLFQNGLFVFTSDHGEAFYEHGTREHTGRPHEEKVRIPLFLFGMGIHPGDVTFGAHHIDLPPTLCRLAGVPPAPDWAGESLLGLDHERVLFSYNEDERGAYLATIEGQRKLLESADAGRRPGDAFDEAYSLTNDPGEQKNLARQKPEWALDLSHRAAAQLDDLFLRHHTTTAAQLPQSTRADLQALGYGE